MRRRLSTLLLLAGGAVLVWSFTVWVSVAIFQRWEQLHWEARQGTASSPPAQTAEGAVRLVLPGAKAHQVVGWLKIPRLRVSTAVIEGDDAVSLRYGAGHIPSTPLPGEAGNTGIAAHRDGFFHSLAGVRPSDRIELKTATGSYNYTVESTRVVQPTNVEVLDSSGKAELTLVTCYPFRYTGPAPLRFIVRARLTD
jgi:sortase A